MPGSERPDQPQSASGFVQIGALAGLAVVAGIVSLALSDNMTLGRRTAAFERLTLGSIVADSAIRRLLSSIGDPSDPLAAAVGVSGAAYPLELSGLPATLAIEGEAGKINPLTVAMPVLAQYVRNAALPVTDEAALMALLDQARTAGDIARAMEGLSSFLAPRISSEELDRDFTVRSNLAGVDPQYASERVLRALPDVSEAMVRTIVRRRSEEVGAQFPVSSRYFSTGRPEFTIVASVHWNARDVFVKRMPIELTTAGRVLVLDGFR